jgi:NADPH-dependent ferric siderophore reductase
MIRIVAEGPELAGFVSGAPDDHVKVFVEGEPGELDHARLPRATTMPTPAR